jgi:hypothetical protein
MRAYAAAGAEPNMSRRPESNRPGSDFRSPAVRKGLHLPYGCNEAR